MKVTYLVVGAVAIVSGAAVQGTVGAVEQQPVAAPVAAAVQKVRIVVAAAEEHAAQCKGGKYQPVDILVDASPKNNAPSHCVKGAVLDHANAHKYPSTIVQLSYKAKDSVLWYSDVEFQIASIEPHDDKSPGTAPKNPFVKPILKMPSKALESGPIVEGAVNHRYKISLLINGRPIDPDLWCNP